MRNEKLIDYYEDLLYATDDFLDTTVGIFAICKIYKPSFHFDDQLNYYVSNNTVDYEGKTYKYILTVDLVNDKDFNSQLIIGNFDEKNKWINQYIISDLQYKDGKWNILKF